jgi:hypothetical protein
MTRRSAAAYVEDIPAHARRPETPVSGFARPVEDDVPRLLPRLAEVLTILEQEEKGDRSP